MSRPSVTSAILFVVILILRPFSVLLSQGRVVQGPKDFVYDID